MPSRVYYRRYTAFIPLYPLGVMAEMAVLADALPTLRAKRMYSVAMPNAYNFTFQYDVFIMVRLILVCGRKGTVGLGVGVLAVFAACDLHD